MVLPLLPTTVFLLLAAFSLRRGNDRIRSWFDNNKLFSHYIKNYREKKGMPVDAKISSILILWISISISIYFIDNIYIRILLLVVLAGVTIHIVRLPDYKENNY